MNVPNPERERSYRQGYSDGVEAAISGLSRRLSEEERRQIEVWFMEALSPWSKSLDMTVNPPPTFPRVEPDADRT